MGTRAGPNTGNRTPIPRPLDRNLLPVLSGVPRNFVPGGGARC
jgi:hypothetical protein